MSKSGTVLVTGGTGLVGGALVPALQNNGYGDVIAVGSKDCDLTNKEAVFRLFERIRPEYLFHMAAKVYGLGGNAKFKALLYYDNILINTHVIEAARRAGVKKVVAMGTVAGYPWPPTKPVVTEDVFLEGRPHPGESGYATAKRVMLAQLEAYRESYGMPYAYAVSTNLYGPNDRFDVEYGHVIPSLVRKFSEARDSGRSVAVWGDGQDTRDFLYVDDATVGLILMLEHLEGAVNLATGQSSSIREVVDLLCGISGVYGVEWDDARPKGESKRAYDVTKLKETGFKPHVDLRTGLERTYAWYRANTASRRV